MDLNLVTAFVRVVEARSFTGAAQSLGVPKSSVSRRVTELEKTLGVTLLHRTTRKLALTEAGRIYFDEASRALSGLDTAAELASGLDEEPRGTVRLTAPVNVGVMGLAEMLSEFSERHPDIHIDLSLNSQAPDLVANGLDIGIREGKVSDANLVVRRVGNAALGVFAAPAYLERRGEPKTVAALGEHEAVLLRAQDGRALWRFDGPNGEVATVEVTGRMNVDELLFVRQALATGFGIGLLPILVESACTEKKKLDPLKRVLPDYRIRGAELAVVTPSGPKRPRRVTLLRDFLVEQMAGRCPKSD
jgi:DNA-binding transcriptional LysR family regulator